MKLRNKVALVTGASKGLGAEIALHLAREGAKVAINYLSDTNGALNTLNKILQEKGKGKVYQANIIEESNVTEMIESIRSELGPIDIIVNNATGPQPFIPIEEQTWDDYLNQLNFFVKAPLTILKACLHDMKQNRYGRIINIGSEVVELGNREFAHYVSAKGAMLGLTRSWANELGADNITCNLIAPGWIPVERHKDVNQSEKDEYVQGVFLGFQGTPSDIAKTVTFLASEDARFITGQKVAVNGGKTLL